MVDHDSNLDISFFVSITYERLPKFCIKYGVFTHKTVNCKKGLVAADRWMDRRQTNLEAISRGKHNPPTEENVHINKEVNNNNQLKELTKNNNAQMGDVQDNTVSSQGTARYTRQQQGSGREENRNCIQNVTKETCYTTVERIGSMHMVRTL